MASSSLWNESRLYISTIYQSLMFDGASTNRSFMLNQDPRTYKFTVKNMFNNQYRLYVIRDSKHATMKIRNNIEARIINCLRVGTWCWIKSHFSLWKHIKEAYQFNIQAGRLTKEYVELPRSTKMRNKLAEHVLDKDILFHMKSYQATLDDPGRLSWLICLSEKNFRWSL